MQSDISGNIRRDSLAQEVLSVSSTGLGHDSDHDSLARSQPARSSNFPSFGSVAQDMDSDRFRVPFLQSPLDNEAFVSASAPGPSSALDRKSVV